MLLYIGKAAGTASDCPISPALLGNLISWMFENNDRAEKVCAKFRDNRLKIHQKYCDGTAGSLVSPAATSYKDALSRRDRSLFQHIDLFPRSIANSYKDTIQWFSSFLMSEMDEKYMTFVWKYLEKIDQQAGPL